MSRAPARRFEDVDVWKKAHAWVLGVYRFSDGFPKHEAFGLRAQLRDAAVSVPGNFAEGFKRRTVKDKARSYNIAQSSLEESRYFLILSQDLGYGDATALREDAEEIARMLNAYLVSLSRGSSRSEKRRDPATVHRFPEADVL